MFPVATSLSVVGKQPRTINRSAPQVQATILFAILDGIVVAEAARIDFIVGLQIAVIQIFCHPPLIADFHNLVDLAVALIDNLLVRNFGIQVIPSFHEAATGMFRQLSAGQRFIFNTSRGPRLQDRATGNITLRREFSIHPIDICPRTRTVISARGKKKRQQNGRDPRTP